MCWSLGEVLMCYVNTHHPSPRTVPFGTCPRDIHTHTKNATLRCDTNCGLCTSGLNDPLPLSQIVRVQLLGDLSRRHCIERVLLIGRNNQRYHIAHLVLDQHVIEFFLCILNPVRITAANVDQAAYSPALLVPKMLDLALAFRAPHSETWILILHCLNVETDGQVCGRRFIQFTPIQYCGRSTRIEPNQQYPRLGLISQALPFSFSPSPHGCGSAPELHLSGPFISSASAMPPHVTVPGYSPRSVHGQ